MGLSTEQMKNAPRGAFYVWMNDLLGYPQRLARHLGREDLVIVAAQFMNVEKVRGKKVDGEDVALVIDHAVEPFDWSRGLYEAVRFLEERKKL